MTNMTTATEQTETDMCRAGAELDAALANGRATSRCVHAYQTAFDNPYSGEQHEASRQIDRALRAFGPIVAAALADGHGSRWINNRLPDGLEFMPAGFGDGPGVNVTMRNTGCCFEVDWIAAD